MLFRVKDVLEADLLELVCNSFVKCIYVSFLDVLQWYDVVIHIGHDRAQLL